MVMWNKIYFSMVCEWDREKPNYMKLKKTKTIFTLNVKFTIYRTYFSSERETYFGNCSNKRRKQSQQMNIIWILWLLECGNRHVCVIVYLSIFTRWRKFTVFSLLTHKLLLRIALFAYFYNLNSVMVIMWRNLYLLWQQKAFDFAFSTWQLSSRRNIHDMHLNGE